MTGAFMQEVTLVRAPLVTDKYGNETSERDWNNATRTVYSGVNVQPSSVENSTEEMGDRNPVVTSWRLITPKGRDIPLLHTDRVEYDGMTMEVYGEVGRYHFGGRVHHVEAALKRVSG